MGMTFIHWMGKKIVPKTKHNTENSSPNRTVTKPNDSKQNKRKQNKTKQENRNVITEFQVAIILIGYCFNCSDSIGFRMKKLFYYFFGYSFFFEIKTYRILLHKWAMLFEAVPLQRFSKQVRNDNSIKFYIYRGMFSQKT